MDIISLIARLKKGQEPAYKELVFAFSARLMTVARIYSKNEEDAKDVLQDAFILVFKKVKSFEGTEERAFYGWMKKLIINLCLSRNQRKFRHLEKSLETIKVEQSVHSAAISNLSHEEIMNLIFELPDGYRQVFALYAIEGFSHKEIAEQLTIAEGSSRSQYSRARKILQFKCANLFKVMTA